MVQNGSASVADIEALDHYMNTYSPEQELQLTEVKSPY